MFLECRGRGRNWRSRWSSSGSNHRGGGTGIIASALGGAVGGAISALAGGTLGGAVGGAVSAGITTFANAYSRGDSVSSALTQAGLSAGIGGAIGGLLGFSGQSIMDKLIDLYGLGISESAEALINGAIGGSGANLQATADAFIQLIASKEQAGELDDTLLFPGADQMVE